jgi:arabinan endo-1,5-alpha-L-arabinosidase
VANRTFKFIVLLFTTVLFATSVCYSTNPITKAKFQSYNYPNMYIRHANFDARIDENVTPEMDSQWELVPGLANSGDGYVSIQSVNYPGYYLRHSNYDLSLEKNDGTSLFAESATFKIVPGLADPSYISFQSYNFPTRYIRHYNYLLRLDEIVTELDRQDATFKIISEDTQPPAPTLIGDVNADGKIDSTDLTLLKRYLLRSATLTEEKILNADTDGNGTVNSTDLNYLKKYILRVISVFPAEGNKPPTPTPTKTPVATPSPTQPLFTPSFKDVTVHDPSVIKTNGTYYVIGSHLAFAKTNDLIQWQQINSSVYTGNPLIPNVFDELKEAFEWAKTDTMWAGDIIQLRDGKYYMYYCMCKGDSPLSALGVARADKVEGPYKNLGILLRSGAGKGEDGTNYNATIHPNAVDPHTFFDKNGDLWMVYGSYSGGIYILKMNPSTGKQYPGQGYGKKLLGANHSRIEGPYIQYSPDTGYYYLFLSFGGLTADGGYNIRVARSQNPDGPYYDAEGNNMINCRGPAGSFFDDRAIEPYGVKLMGNFRFVDSGIGYVSPGHNSTYYDEESGKYFIIFHTRFPGKGEMHQVRVHQMFINEDGWPVIAPHRYAGETIRRYSPEEVAGTYAYINHGRDISANIKNSVRISLNKDGTVSGNGVNGRWELSGEHYIRLTVNGTNYTGVVLQQWDDGLKKYVMTFSAISRNGNVTIWGSQL